MHEFPFSAVVGQEDVKLALLLNAIDPAIGGVLLRGQKGSAKTTLARGLARLLAKEAPFVELPVGATEDRLVGTVDIAAALTEGERRFQPGLLAEAHGGVLYVDEVNLLPDHLVDVLLDVAASGVNRVEREGVSHEHPSRFVLIGSMNPEEGELRPQLLDRFGLAVDVAASIDPDERAEAVTRRLDFDRNPLAFLERWSGADVALRTRLAAARPAGVAPALVRIVSAVCAAMGAEGLRADLVVCRAAAAYAGWRGRAEATVDDVRRVAPLALAHRRRRSPFEEPGIALEALEQALQRALSESQLSESSLSESSLSESPHQRSDHALERSESSLESSASPLQSSESALEPSERSLGPSESSLQSRERSLGPCESSLESSESPLPSSESALESFERSVEPSQWWLQRSESSVGRSERPLKTSGSPLTPSEQALESLQQRRAPYEQGLGERSLEASTAQPVGEPTRIVRLEGAGGSQAAGRRTTTEGPRGRMVGDRPMPTNGGGGSLALGATARAAVVRRAVDGGAALETADLREAVREQRAGNLIVLAVDASGSMGAERRMEAAKGAVLSVLLDAYQRRDRVAMVTFRGDGAEVALRPTGSVEVAQARLAELPTGGRTPLAAGIETAVALADRHRSGPHEPLLVVVSDGRATAGPPGVEPVHAAMEAAAAVKRRGIAAAVIDAEDGHTRLGLARPLAAAMGARYLRVPELSAGSLEAAIRQVGGG